MTALADRDYKVLSCSEVEADEAILAYFKLNKVAAVLSSDFDYLVFGMPMIVSIHLTYFFFRFFAWFFIFRLREKKDSFWDSIQVDFNSHDGTAHYVKNLDDYVRVRSASKFSGLSLLALQIIAAIGCCDAIGSTAGEKLKIIVVLALI